MIPRALILLTASFLGVTPLAAAEVISVEADRTEFKVTMSDGKVLRSADLVGARLTIVMRGQPRRIRIDAVERDPKAQRGAVWLHSFSVQGPDGAWTNLCMPHGDGSQLGFPVAGRARVDGIIEPAEPGVMEVACTSGAQVKCIRFGYLPWDAESGDLYNACIRMTRADYCGDGTATTLNGQIIDMYDDHTIQRPENSHEHEFEAGWAPNGAVCVRHVRVKQNVSLESLVAACPRLKDRVGEMCTEEKARSLGARLFNRSRP